MALKIFSLVALGAKWIMVSLKIVFLKNIVLIKLWQLVLIAGRFALTMFIGTLRILKLAMMGNPLGLFLVGISTVAVLIIANWEKVKSWFSSFFDWIAGSSVFKALGKITSSIKSFFGGDDGEEKASTKLNVSNSDVNKVKEASKPSMNNSSIANNQRYNFVINIKTERERYSYSSIFK